MHETNPETAHDNAAPNIRAIHWSHLRDFFRFARRRLKNERLPQVAGSLTFTTVLALVPMLTIALAIFTTFPMFNTFRTSLEAYLVQKLIPTAISNTILDYLGLFAAKASRLSVVGAIALLATTVTTMAMVDRTLNHIWRVKTKRPLMQRVVAYWTIITVGPLLIGASITLTSLFLRATSSVMTNLPFFSGLVSGLFYTIISIALTTVAFTLLYMVIPNRFVDWRDAAWGGLIAAVAFEVAKRLFAIFVTRFPSYTVIYGALAAVPIFLVWVYLSWLIILVCAAIVAALPVIKYERWWHVATPGSAFVDGMAVLRVLVEARIDGISAETDAVAIRERTQLGFDESEQLLMAMLGVGWVARIHRELPKRSQWGKRLTEGLDGWTLLVNPQKLTVADVYRLFVFNEIDNPATSNPTLVRKVDAAIEQGLSETLAAHFSQQHVTS